MFLIDLFPTLHPMPGVNRSGADIFQRFTDMDLNLMSAHLSYPLIRRTSVIKSAIKVSMPLKQ